ncbi:hypothetical protein KGM_204987 [Danaus plexippus plexippus]|uniref:Uncharacterized protein n=1 Tax=Danaus plexippus plexippus TaxID=278856 RepID=A0A212EVK7_DANPL|nr:hypothetical protein KGM_204987 [Danaus plexippus plexippus]
MVKIASVHSLAQIPVVGYDPYDLKSNILSSACEVYKSEKHDSVNNEIKIFGGGFACLLHKICQEKSLPCLILYKYCSEGDNLPDAYEMIGTRGSASRRLRQSSTDRSSCATLGYVVAYRNSYVFDDT